LDKQLYYTRGLNECLTCDVNALVASLLALLNASLVKD
jgi:energy-converting hydrogenase Eha subunit F